MEKGISKYEKIFNIGDKFGNWSVIDNKIVFGGGMREYSVKVRCNCDKATERYVSCRKLKKGISWGCDCVRRKENSHFWKGIGEISGKYISQIRNRAKIKNIEMSLDKKYLWNLYLSQNKKCALSGIDICFGGRNYEIEDKFEEDTASLDRIDSSKGYIKGNVQWVHKDINMMKNVFSVEKFKKLCKIITEYGN